MVWPVALSITRKPYFGAESQAHGTFDHAEDEQSQTDHADQHLDTPAVVQKYRRDSKRTLEVTVSSLDSLLALVEPEYFFGIGFAGVDVAEQGVPTVSGGLGSKSC